MNGDSLLSKVSQNSYKDAINKIAKHVDEIEGGETDVLVSTDDSPLIIISKYSSASATFNESNIAYANPVLTIDGYTRIGFYRLISFADNAHLIGLNVSEYGAGGVFYDYTGELSRVTFGWQGIYIRNDVLVSR